MHTFWQTIYGGTRYDSGTEGLSFYGLFLNHVTDKTDDNDKPPNELEWSLGFSTGLCPKASFERQVANSWPNWTIHYHLYPGPNSNTVASWINYTAGLNASPPPGALGWWFVRNPAF